MLRYSFLFLLICLNQLVFGQEGVTLKGKVVDVDGDPVPGVKVQLHELARTVGTNIEGAYLFLDVPKGRYHIHFEALGLRPKTLDTLITTPVVINVVLEMA